MKKIIVLFAFCALLMTGCKNNKEEQFNQEKQELEIFIQKWIGFNSALQKDRIKDIFLNDENSVYIPLERNDILHGYKNIYNYWDEKTKDFDLVDYNLWEKKIFINNDFSSASLFFKANRKIKLKSGFIVDLKEIRTSIFLVKDGGKWKINTLNESIKQK